MERLLNPKGKVVDLAWSHKPGGGLLLTNLEEALKGTSSVSGTLSMRRKTLASSETPLEVSRDYQESVPLLF